MENSGFDFANGNDTGITFLYINGFLYTQAEIFEALRTKGYLLLRYNYTDTDETFPGGVETFEIKTYCALKGEDMPCEKNLWQNVAIREFQKEFVKPKLV
ncbi:hypothetical protein EGH90_12425 [Kaistella haifensis]|nr:hypothetical protein EGH90_12425 [Kaistella haifensis]